MEKERRKEEEREKKKKEEKELVAKTVHHSVGDSTYWRKFSVGEEGASVLGLSYWASFYRLEKRRGK